MRKILIPIAGLLFIAAYLLQAQVLPVSYIIPDIGAPDMNTYVEIIAPYDANDTYGNDAMYLNNPGDDVRVRVVNAADTSRITIGPLVVSWNGRMISTQIYVHPWLKPNSSDWQALNPEFIIPLVVEVNGTVSETFNFYILKPYNLGNNGDISAVGDNILGEGNLGKRSPRGAMIVDSLIMGGKQYRVSVLDCDPNTVGNQGYLPFILMSKGKITGTSNTIINCGAGGGSGVRQDGGPGGGGGGGQFCDNIGTGSRGGDGFTGGGPGGLNSPGNNDKNTPGTGTGAPSTLKDANGDVYIGGHSLNDVPGGSSTLAWESSGGGTGHPFGLSGEGCISGDACDPDGGYGGGSGYRQKKDGGGGGYGTAGANNGGSTKNGGKVNGNIMVVPIAGGSGGASGNPQADNILHPWGCSGDGGGGGGAVRVFGEYISTIQVHASGNNGGSRDVTEAGNGGGGSGGHTCIESKLFIQNSNLTATGGTRGGGEGRFRVDYTTTASYNTNPSSPASFYRGISTDTTHMIKKSFRITGGSQTSRNVTVYLKPESGLWSQLPAPTYTAGGWYIDITVPDTDTLFFLAAMQDVPNPRQDPVADEYIMEPGYVMSQAAANILRQDPLPKIAGEDTVMKFRVFKCIGSSDTSTAWVLNIGKAPLNLTYDNTSFSPGGQGFELVPPVKTSVAPGDSIPVTVRFTYQDGQSGTIYDTLNIEHNDLESNRRPWKIFLEANIINLDFEISKLTDTLDFGELCVDEYDTLYFDVDNLSDTSVTLKNPWLGTSNANFIPFISGSSLIPQGGKASVGVSFHATKGASGAMIIVGIEECPDKEDTIYAKGTGVTAEIALKSPPTDTLDMDTICVGQTVNSYFEVTNKSIVDVNLKIAPQAGQNVVTASITGSPMVAPDSNKRVDVSATPDKEGPFLYQIFYGADECGGFGDTIYVRGTGVTTNIAFDPHLLDFGEVKVGNDSTMQTKLTNNGPGNAYIEEIPPLTPPFSVIDNQPPVPVLLRPGESIDITIGYSPNNDQMHRDTLILESVEISGSCVAIDSLFLQGQGIKSNLELSKDLLEYDTTNCHTQRDSVTITNTGTAAVNIIKHAITGADAQYFAMVGARTVPYQLGPGESYTYVIEFRPGQSAESMKNAVLEITSEDNSVYKTNLQGHNEPLMVDLPANVIFNSGPIGPPQQKIITAVNQGTFDAHLVNVISDNPKVTVTPTTAVIAANGGTQDFTVTMQMDEAGSADAKLLFIFDSHCDDTIMVNVSGRVLDGNIDVPTAMDFGTLTPCEDSVMILTINNTGETDVTINNMQITGTDSGLFTFVTSFVPPVVIPPDSAYTIDIRFDPRASTDGMKNAKVTFTANYNNKDNDYEVSLAGIRKSGLLKIPQDVNFGNRRIGKTYSQTVTLKNAGELDINITGNDNLKNPGVFGLNPQQIFVLLAKGDSTRIRIDFSPTVPGCVYDTLLLRYKVGDCVDSTYIYIAGCGIQSGQVTLMLPVLKDVDPFIDNFRIPVTAKVNEDYDNEPLVLSSAEITVSFDANTFMPVKSEPGALDIAFPVGRRREVTLRLNGPVNIYKTPTKMADIIGNTMLGDTVFTDLMFESSTLLDADTLELTGTVTDTGSISFRICKAGGKRLLQGAYPLTLAVSPNPVNETMNVFVMTNEAWQHKLEIIDMLGQAKTLKVWNAGGDGRNDFNFTFDTGGFADGVYFIRVTSLSESKVVKIRISK